MTQTSEHPIFKQLSDLVATDFTKLQTRELDGATYDTSAAARAFAFVFPLLVKLRDHFDPEWPEYVMQFLKNALQNASRARDQVAGFNPGGRQVHVAQTEMLNRIVDFVKEFFAAAGPVLHYISSRDRDLPSFAEDVQQRLSNTIGMVSASLEEIVSARDEAVVVLDGIRETAAQAGVSQNAEAFASEVRKHEEAAGRWLVSLINFVVLTLASAGVSVWVLIEGPRLETGQVVQLGFIKLIVFSTLVYGAIWSGKNYRSHRHLQAVNQHRANALQTFRSFYAATESEQIREAILLHAAQAAFGHISTGFDSSDERSDHGLGALLVPLSTTLQRQNG